MSFTDVPGFVTDLGAGNDKIVTVPINETWKLLGVYAELITTATVGVRQLRVQVRDASNGLLVVEEWSEAQVASLTKNYVAAPEVAQFSDLTSEMLYKGIPSTRLIVGFDIRVFDDNNIDVLDVLNVQVNRVKDTEQ